MLKSLQTGDSRPPISVDKSKGRVSRWVAKKFNWSSSSWSQGRQLCTEKLKNIWLTISACPVSAFKQKHLTKARISCQSHLKLQSRWVVKPGLPPGSSRTGYPTSRKRTTLLAQSHLPRAKEATQFLLLGVLTTLALRFIATMHSEWLRNRELSPIFWSIGSFRG